MCQVEQRIKELGKEWRNYILIGIRVRLLDGINFGNGISIPVFGS